MEINKIYNEDCFTTMDNMIKSNIKVNNIITSPFYNTSRGSKCHISQKKVETITKEDMIYI